MFGTGDFGEPRSVALIPFAPFYIAENRTLESKKRGGNIIPVHDRDSMKFAD